MHTPSLPPDPNDLTSPRRARLDWLLVGASLAVIVGIWFATPGGLLDKADHIGYAVCHRIPVRSPFFDGRQLPLCARCSGQFLGALGGLALLLVLRRGRVAQLPPWPITATLIGFLALWAFDGVNSYLTFFPTLPHLYEPRNILRTTTGALQGVALISLVWPFVSVSLWAQPEASPSLRNARELALLTGIAALIVLAVGSEWGPLLYPLALLSVAGTVMLLMLVNTMLLVIALKREALATRGREIVPVLLGGLALALMEVLLINLVRAWLTARWNLPF